MSPKIECREELVIGRSVILGELYFCLLINGFSMHAALLRSTCNCSFLRNYRYKKDKDRGDGMELDTDAVINPHLD